MIEYTTFFKHCFVINLKRREDRKKEFLEQVKKHHLEYLKAEFIEAVEGRNVIPPSWWGTGSNSWACYQSHFSIIQRALSNNYENVLILEDDALFQDNFNDNLCTCLNELPFNWDFFYLGGQHLKRTEIPSYLISDHICSGRNVNRKHAYALNNKALKEVYKFLLEYDDWDRKHHIDHRYGVLHEQAALNVYCAYPWLVGQSAGKSDVYNRELKSRVWDIDYIVKRQELNSKVDLQHASTGYGTVGLNGKLGYEDKKVDVYSEYSNVTWLSAHAPSRIVLNVKEPIAIFGAYDATAKTNKECMFIIDGGTNGTIKAANTHTCLYNIDKGTHVIEFKPYQNADITNMHTVLGICNPISNTTSTVISFPVSLKNNGVTLISGNVGYGSLTLPEPSKVKLSFPSDDIVYVSAHAPSTIHLKVEKPVYIFGGISSDTDLCQTCTFTDNKKIIGKLYQGNLYTRPHKLEIGEHTIEITTVCKDFCHTLLGIIDSDSDPFNTIQNDVTKLGIVVVAVNIPGEIKNRWFMENYTKLNLSNTEICMVTDQTEDVWCKSKYLNKGLRELIKRGCDIIATTDIDMVFTEELINYTKNVCKDTVGIWNVPCYCDHEAIDFNNLNEQYIRTRLEKHAKGGWLCYSKNDWLTLGGYDETYIGPGGMDTQAYNMFFKKVKGGTIICSTLPLIHINHSYRYDTPKSINLNVVNKDNQLNYLIE